MGFFEEHPEKVQDVPGGKLCQVFGEAEGASCSVALVKYEEGGQGILHYHNTITEVYVFAEGTGKIMINGFEHEVKPKDIFVVTPHNTHFVQALSPLSFMCVCTPPWLPEREFEESSFDSQKGDIQRIVNQEEIFQTDEVSITLKRMKNCEIKLKSDQYHVVYFLLGSGTIIIDEMEITAKLGEAIELPNKEAILKADDELEYIEVISH